MTVAGSRASSTGRRTMSVDVDALRMALQAQRAGAEAALVDLEAAVNGGDRAAGEVSSPEVDEAAVRALATTVLDDLAAWSEMWRGVAKRPVASAPAPDSAPGRGGTEGPRKMHGISMTMGGLSLGELKSAIGTRKSAPSAMEYSEEKVKTGAGVVVVPIREPVATPDTGKPAWMVELAAKKKAREDAEAAKLGL